MSKTVSDEKPASSESPRADLLEIVVQDISMAMEKNATEFSHIFDDHLYIAILDHDGRMITISKKMRADFSLPAHAVESLSNFIWPTSDDGDDVKVIWRAIAQDGKWAGDVCHHSKDGTICWLRTSIVAFIGDNLVKSQYLAIFSDITARMENEAALRVSRNDLRALANHLDFSQECDRKRIAREIHDELGQHLLALKMDLFSLQLSSAMVRPGIASEIPGLMRSVDETMLHVKNIINDLRPIALDSGLVEAVRACVASFTRRHNIPCDLSVSDVLIELNEIAVTTLYRVLQESLVNVGRHAQANRVCITLLCSRNAISIEIDDNGIGMTSDVRSRRKTFGLLGMKERVEMLGGTLKIISEIGTGTRVIASMPHK